MTLVCIADAAPPPHPASDPQFVGACSPLRSNVAPFSKVRCQGLRPDVCVDSPPFVDLSSETPLFVDVAERPTSAAISIDTTDLDDVFIASIPPRWAEEEFRDAHGSLCPGLRLCARVWDDPPHPWVRSILSERVPPGQSQKALPVHCPPCCLRSRRGIASKPFLSNAHTIV